MSNDMENSVHTIGEYFEELVQKTNLEYQNSNISIKANLHCFEMAAVRDNVTGEMVPISEDVSDKMSGILDEFKNLKKTPKKLKDTLLMLLYYS